MAYDAIVLDIDGTLLDEQDRIPDKTRAALERARRSGVKVMLATGRSHLTTRQVALDLGLEEPAVVFNGAAVYDAVADDFLELFALPESVVEALLAHADVAGFLPIVARSDGMFGRHARSELEARVLSGYPKVSLRHTAELPRNQALRVTLFSDQHDHSHALLLAVQRAVRHDAYHTHFALAAIAAFRDSTMQVLDVQPPCAGKAEALRVLAARHGIAPERVVAVGDADNDLPMIEAAGLGVAMGNATDTAKQAADRVIGHHGSDALAELIDELFQG